MADTTITISGGSATIYSDNNGSFSVATINGGSLNPAPGEGVSYASTSSFAGTDNTAQFFSIVGNKVTLNAGGGSNTIEIKGSSALVTAGSANDTVTIASGGTNSTVFGGTGNDSILNNVSNVTIDGGDGNDYIKNSIANNSVLFQFSGGQDTIEGLGSNTLKLTGTATDFTIGSATLDGANLVLGIGTGGTSYVSLSGVANFSNLNIKDSTNADYTLKDIAISLTGSNPNYSNTIGSATIKSESASSTITNSAASVSILTGDSNDEITNSNGKNVTIDAGDGANKITINGGESISISSGSGKDSIYLNGGSSITINAGAGENNITIEQSAHNILFVYGGGSDTIKSFGAHTLQVTESGGISGATLNNSNNLVLTVGGKQILLGSFSLPSNTFSLASANIQTIGNSNATITNFENSKEGITIAGTSADEIIENKGSNVKINADGGSNQITNTSGNNVTITTGDNNDTISVTAGSTISINAGGGSNEINIGSNASNVTITGGSDVDKVTIAGNTVSFSGASGVDEISVTGNFVTINGGADTDKVTNSGGSAVISLGIGNDTITNSGNNATIYGGAGDDSIVNKSGNSIGSNVVFVYGGGSDTIENFVAGGNSASTLKVDGFTISSATLGSGSAITLSLDGNSKIELKTLSGLGDTLSLAGLNIYNGNSKITLNNIEIDTVPSSGFSAIIGTDAAETINNSASGITINGGGGNDSINNSGDSATLIGGAGKDYIENSGKSAVIDGGDDNDTIKNTVEGVSISGGSGADSIYNSGDSVTILGGTGNDLITLSGGGSKIFFQYDSGKDTIYGLGESSTLKIANTYATNASVTYDGKSVSISGENNNILALVNAASLFGGLSILNVKQNAPVTLNHITITRASGYNDDFTIAGTSTDDTIVNSAETITIDAGKGDDYINNSASAVSIYGGADGTATIKNTGDKVMIAGTSGADSINNTGTSVLINTGTSATAGTKDTIINSGDSSTISVEAAAKAEITNSGKFVVINGGASGDTITNTGENVTINAGNGDDSIKNTKSNVTISAGGGSDYIENSVSNVSVTGGADNDTISNAKDSVTIAGGSGADSIYNTAKNVLFIYGGGSDTINGFNNSSTLKIAQASGASSTVSGVTLGSADASLNIGSDVLTLKNAASLVSSLTLFNANGTQASSLTGITITLGDDANDKATTINSSLTRVTIAGNSSANTIKNYGTNVSIGGVSGLNIIENYAATVTITGGDDGDKITNNAATVTIDGGKGTDTITNNKDATRVVISGGSGADSISNSAATVTINAGDDNDTILNNADHVTINGNQGNNVITNTSLGNYVVINGGSSGETINNAGNNVSILTGAGNDLISLTSGSNNGKQVTIKYGGGSDIIYGYNSDVVSRLYTSVNADTISATSNGKDLVLKIDDDDKVISLVGGLTLNSTLGNLYKNFNNNNTLKIGAITITGTSGKDTFSSVYDNATIDGGAEADKITINSSTVSVTGGAGNDTLTINTGVKNISIGGGSGDDSIVNNSTGIVFQYTSGNDYISGFDMASSLQLMGESATITAASLIAPDKNNANKIYLNIGSDTLTLAGTALKLDELKLYSVSTGSASTIGLSGIKITGSAKDDTYNNAFDSVNMSFAGGNDLVTNTGASAFFDLGAGNDTITNTGASATIAGGEGNDSIVTSLASAVSINAGKGANYIINYDGASATILAGADSDTILNQTVTSGKAEKVFINAGDGKNFITNYGASATIYSGKDNDTIDNTIGADKSLISLTGGANIIRNTGASAVSIYGGAGNDNIVNSTINGGTAQKVYIQLSAGGKNTVNNAGEAASIFGGAGVELVTNSGASAVISLGAGNDTLYNETATGASIYGGAGVDHIENKGASVYIDGGDDNDYIISSVTTATALSVLGGKGNDTIRSHGAAASILGGEGKDSIQNYGEGTYILGGESTDTVGDYILSNVTSGTATVSIIGNKGNDTISASGSVAASIIGGLGDDSINSSVNSATIYADTADYTASDGGKDIIINSGTNAVIYAGTGENKITNSGAGTSIFGGASNDSIFNTADDGFTYVYSIGGGNDTISGFNDNSTFSIQGSTDDKPIYYSSTVKSGKNNSKDAVVTFFRGGKAESTVTLAGIGNTVNIAGASLDTVLRLNDDVASPFDLSTMTLGDSKVGTSIKVVDASSRTKAINIAGNSLANSIVGGKGGDTLFGGAPSSTIADSLTGGDGADVFVFNGGQVLIKDYKPGDDKIRIADTLRGSGTVKGYYDDFSISGSGINSTLILGYGDGNSLSVTGSNGGGEQKISFLEGSSTVVKYYKGDAIFNNDIGSATSATLSKTFTTNKFDAIGDNNYSSAGKLVTIDASTVGSGISIIGNANGNYIVASSLGASMDGGAGNDTMIGGASADIFLYEKGTGNDVVSLYSSAADSISLGADLVESTIADTTYNTKTGDVTVKFDKNNSIVIKPATTDKDKYITFVGGINSTFSLDAAGVFVDKTTNPTAVSLPTTFATTYTVPTGVASVDAHRVSKIFITGNTLDNYLVGGDGDDTLFGAANVKTGSKDSLTGGKGADVFIFSGGTDSIADYKTSDGDKISLDSLLTYADYAYDTDGNLVLGYGTGNSLTFAGVSKDANNTITFANGKNTTVNVYQQDGIFDTKMTTVTLASSVGSFSATVDGYSSLLTINATSVTAGSGTSITGNTKNNYIIAGNNGASMDGGAGNDTLVGGKGKDIFIYEKSDQGNDVIIGYGANSAQGAAADSISLGGDIKAIDDITFNEKTKDVTIKLGSNTITLDDVNPTVTAVTFVGKVEGTFSIPAGVFVDKTTNPTAVSLPTTFATTYTVPTGVASVDASKVSKAIAITMTNTSSGAANSILGSKNNDTLYGATGTGAADSLTGGEGNDVFVYYGGKDVITDYSGNGSLGADKIVIDSSRANEYSDYFFGKVDNKDYLVLGYGSENSLSLAGVGATSNNTITFANGKNTTVNVYQSDGIFDTKKSMVTLASEKGSFDAKTYSDLVTIDATKSTVTTGVNITGNDKNNYIIAGSMSGASMNGKDGNDTLVGNKGADIFIYESSVSGNDVIENYNVGNTTGSGVADSISLGSGVTITDYSTKGNDVTFKIDKASIVVKGVGSSLVTFAQGASTMGYKDGVFANMSTSSASLMPSYADKYTINGTLFDGGESALLHADASTRTKQIEITGNPEANSIIGGAGNDTLNGLTGNDSLTGGKGNDVFIFSGGQDVIVDYNKDGADKIFVASSIANNYSDYSLSGNDLIIGYTSNGENDSLKIVGGKDKEITFMEGDNGKKTVTYIYRYNGIFDPKATMVTLASNTTNFDGTASSLNALATIDGTAVGQSATIKGSAKANVIYAGASGAEINGGAGNDTIYGNSGADLFVYADTASGNDVIYNYGIDPDKGASISGTGADAISIGSGLTVDDVICALSKGNDALIKIGKNTITLKNAGETNVTKVNAITFVGGTSGTFSLTAAGGGVWVNNDGTAVSLPATTFTEYAITGGVSHVDASKASKAINITGDAKANSIIGSTGNDTLDGGGGSDTLTGGKGNDIFVFNGGQDVITDYSTNGTLGADKISLSGASFVGGEKEFSLSSDKKTLVLDFGTSNGADSLTIKSNDPIDALTFADGKKTTTKIYDDRGTFDAKKTSVTIKPDSKGFGASLNGDDGILTISGASVNSGSISIVGNAKNNYIIAGASGASMNGGAGNDTLVGDKGADVFFYESSLSGNDVVSLYGAADSISLGDSLTIEDVTVSKNDDVVIKVGKGSITVKEGKSKEITIVEGGNPKIFKDGLFTDGYGVTLPATYKGEYAVSGNIKNVDASATKKAIKLTGDSNANSLIGGKANDTLSGGKGSNYLDGGDGKNVFIFTGGNDSIANFKATDKISVGSAKETAFAVVGTDHKDLLLTYATGSISIQGGVGKAISFIDDKKKTTIKTYDTVGAFDSKGTSATLAANNTNFNASVTAYAKLATINAESITAADTATVIGNAKPNVISAGAKGAELNGGDGNDTLIGGSGNDVFVYGSGTKPGNDTIKEYISIVASGAGDKISLASGLPIADATAKKNDMVFKIGKNSLTVNNAKTTSTPITFVQGNDTIVFSGGEKGVFLNASSVSASLPTSYKWAYELSGEVTAVDASDVKKGITLSGASASNPETIIGGKGGDTIKSGKNTSDTGIALTGGTGNDVFIYEGGYATITDFFEGKNKISVDSSFSDFSGTGYTINSTGGVVIDYGDESKLLTIANGKDSAISFMAGENGKKTEVRIYTEKGLYDAKKTSVKVLSGLPTFDGDTVVATIDASNHSDAINVNGNTKNNYIIGGAGSDTLNGKTGNDTLKGGNGDDIFVYESSLSGNDVIADYSPGDKISLGSGAAITDVTTKNSDVTVKIGKGSVVIKNNGMNLSEGIVFEGATNGTLNGGVLTEGDKSILFPSYKYEKEVAIEATTGDASSVKGSVTMKGGDSLIGGNGKDVLHDAATLWGGKGNDTLFGGEKYIYHAGEGTDFIKDYGAGDGTDLMLLGKNGGTNQVKVKKGTFKGNDLSLAIEGGGTVILNGATATEFSFSGETWYLSADKKSITKTQPSTEES